MLALETEEENVVEVDHKVSIVIATYRQHTSLPIAIRSALNQTYKNVEVIVVPVESDTKTLEVLGFCETSPGLEKGYSQWFRDVKVVLSDKADYVHQRSLGVLSSTGKWFSWFDSDDFMLPGKIQGDLIVALEEKAYVVYSPLLQADLHFRIVDYVKTEPFSYEALTKNCFITDSSLTLKAMLFEFGLDETQGELAFYDFWLKIAEKYPDRIKLNPFPGVAYCQHDKQMHRIVSPKKKAEQRAKVVAESLERVRKKK